MRSMTKTRKYNDMIDCIGLLYVENETKLLWLIRWCMVYDVDQTGQQRDWSYRCGRNLTIITDQRRCGQSRKPNMTIMRQIVMVWSLQNKILNYQDWSNSVWSMMNMRQEIEVTNHISPLYVENKSELSWLIW